MGSLMRRGMGIVERLRKRAGRTIGRVGRRIGRTVRRVVGGTGGSH
jgi:hypothetical protein